METEDNLNLFLARNGTSCFVKETPRGLDLYCGGSIWIQDIPRDTSSLALLTAIRAAPRQGAEPPAQYQGPGLGRQFVEAGVWGAGITGGSILMGGLISGVLDIFSGGGRDI